MPIKYNLSHIPAFNTKVRYDFLSMIRKVAKGRAAALTGLYLDSASPMDQEASISTFLSTVVPDTLGKKSMRNTPEILSIVGWCGGEGHLLPQRNQK